MTLKRSTGAGLVALIVTASLAIAVFFTLYSLIPITRADQPGLSSLFVGVMMACVMGVQVFTPILVRRFSLRLTLLGSVAVLAAGALVTGWAGSTAMLLVGGVLSGSSFGVLVVAGSQGVALLADSSRLGRAIGIYGLITMGASAVGSPAGVQLALTFSTEVFAVCAALACLLAMAATVGIPGAVGRRAAEEAGQSDSEAPQKQVRGVWSVIAGAPWLILALTLVSMLMLSHGLTSLPVLATAVGSAALVVFAVQAGNAVGRGIGGELGTRLGARTTAITGVVLVAAGGALGVLVTEMITMVIAGVLLGLGVGVVQTLTLHLAMQRMDPGHASVVWNLAVDGGLWAGGILWGLALGAGVVAPVALAFSAVALVLGVMTALHAGVRVNGRAGRAMRVVKSSGH